MRMIQSRRVARISPIRCFLALVIVALLVLAFGSTMVMHRSTSTTNKGTGGSDKAKPALILADIAKIRSIPTTCNAFVFDPLKYITDRRQLRERYLIETIRLDDGEPLINRFDPVRWPHRHLIPMQDEEATALSKFYHVMGDDFTTVVNQTMMEIISDKKRFMRFLVDAGFGDYVPTEYSSPVHVQSFPVIIKLTKSSASRGTFLARNRSHLNAILEEIKGQESVIQEYISNNVERAVHISAVHGNMVRMVCHERRLDEPIYYLRPHWRSTTPAALNNADCHESLYRAMVKAINFTGIGNFDVRLERRPDGDIFPKVIEMNGRVSGTVARNASLLADMICSIQWNGRGIATSHGCQLQA